MRNALTFWKTVLIAAAAIVAADAIHELRLSAQSQTPDPKPPTFEVASVKPTKDSGLSYTLIHPGGRFTATNVTLRGLITRAYQLQNNQVEGGPSWVSADAFDIEAKAEGNPPPEQVRLMVQALLAERFKLR